MAGERHRPIDAGDLVGDPLDLGEVVMDPHHGDAARAQIDDEGGEDLGGMRHLAEQRADERGLAAAIRPDDAMDLPGLDAEADIVEDLRAAELQPDIGEADRRTLHVRRPDHCAAFCALPCTSRTASVSTRMSYSIPSSNFSLE